MTGRGMSPEKKAALQPFIDRRALAASRCPAWMANMATMAAHKEAPTPEEDAALDEFQDAEGALWLASAWWDRVEFERVKAEAVAVCKLIEEAHGASAAHDWLWSCTPYPAGLPSPSQLEEGRQLARGEITLRALLAKVGREMAEAMSRVSTRG